MFYGQIEFVAKCVIKKPVSEVLGFSESGFFPEFELHVDRFAFDQEKPREVVERGQHSENEHAEVEDVIESSRQRVHYKLKHAGLVYKFI